MQRDTFYLIHEAIHDKKIVKPIIEGREYEVKIGGNGCRFIDFIEQGKIIRFMEQNQHKSSSYAQRARNGEKITWGMQPEQWILIDGSDYESWKQKQQI